MGDADIPHVMVPVHEIERIEVALNDASSEMNRVFTFIKLQNDRTTSIMREVSSWQKFRSCFTAFNVFTIPVILAIISTYGIVELLEMSSSSLEYLEAIVMILIFISNFIGLPMYLYTLWLVYFSPKEMEAVPLRRAQKVVNLVENDNHPHSAPRRTLSFQDAFFDAALEVRRWMGHPNGGRFRAAEEKVEETEHESIEEFELASDSEIGQMAEAENDNIVTPESDGWIVLGLNVAPRKEETVLEKEEDIRSVKIAVDANRTSCVEIGKQEETYEGVENMKPLADKNKILESLGTTAFRNITVEKIGDGAGKVLQKKTVTAGVKDHRIEQIFKL